jgi:brefeldin A-resistance guanine nucleotide exchange factor 1
MEQNYVINGVSCIKGEIHSIMTLMRLNTRWSQPSRNNSHNMDDLLIQDENPCVKSFRRLNEYLEGIFDLHEVDCMMYISPFHQVIVSDLASGPLTSAALSSLSKFELYGFLNSDFPRVREGISLIASCISKCVFEETDWESDEVILMKLLELSVLVYRCSSSSLLSVGTAWDIYSTCISIHCEYRASKILKSEAETCLRHLTLTAFSRANITLSVNPINNNINNNNIIPTNDDNNHDIELNNQTWEVISQEMHFSGIGGITILLSKIMSVLSSSMDLQVFIYSILSLQSLSLTIISNHNH